MFGREKERSTLQTQPTQINAMPPPMGAPPPQQTPKIETVIGPNCRITGAIQSDGGIRIEGIFEGSIQTTGNLVVAESATVLADIQAYNISISGSVKGNIVANKIEITETGKVWGDLSINALLLHEGAYLKGQTNMGGSLEPPSIEAPRLVRPTAQLESGE